MLLDRYGSYFSHAVVFACVIPRLAVAAFVWDGDVFVSYSDWIGEIGFNFGAGPLGEFNGELSAKGVVNGVDGFDDKGVIGSAVFRVLPEALHGEVGDVGGIGLGFVRQSCSYSRAIVRTAKEFSNVTGGAGKRTTCFKLLFNIVLIVSDSMVAFKVKGLDDFTFLRRDEHDGELFAVGEVLFKEVLGHFIWLHVIIGAVLNNFAHAVKGFWELSCFDESFDFWAREFVDWLCDVWELSFALKLHEGKHFSGFDFRVVVVDHSGVTKSGAVGGYRPAVCAFKVTLKEDFAGVSDVELAVALGDCLKVSAGAGCGLCAGQPPRVSTNGVVRATNTTVGITINFELFGDAFDFFPG